MTTRLCLTLVLGIAVLSSSCEALSQATNSESMSPVVQSNTRFALELYGKLKSTPGNLFLSPFSISTCLAMTSAGARGDTLGQMNSVLHFAGDDAGVQKSIGELQQRLTHLPATNGAQLNIANALWTEQTHPLEPAFLNVARDQYEAGVKQVDFRARYESARKEINAWVEKQTTGKIRDILAEGSLSPDTRLVLANAIYFKGTWASKFDSKATRDAPFHVTPEHAVAVKMMSRHGRHRIGFASLCSVLELPYTGDDLSMFILLPREAGGLAELESKLTPEMLAQCVSSVRERDVRISIPRFKLESGFELGKVLPAMGMKDAFLPQADFSGIDGIRDLYISSVVHKAYVDVNEEGTEAAAATAVVMMRASAVSPSFVADHPFLFFIRDNRSGSILFLGRFADPSSAKQ